MNTFPHRLKELREQAALTQKQLADKIGSTIRSVSRLETGAQEPTWPVVQALCEALGVDCRAFAEAPANPPGKAKQGRPRKDVN